MTVNAEKFEELLGAELKATLDRERGKAVAAFRGYVAAEEAHQRQNSSGEDGGAGRGGDVYRPDFIKARRGRQISRREAWFWTAAPSLVAACLGVVLTLQVVSGKSHGVPAITAPGNNIAGGVPKDTIQREWVDPNDHATYRLTQPVENVGYQELKPF